MDANTGSDKTTEKKSEKNTKDKILHEYRNYVLMNGKEPPSVYAFCRQIQIGEEDFYGYFNDFSQVAGVFWVNAFEDALKDIRQNPGHTQSSVREKLLDFYYSFFGILRKNRSFALLSFRDTMSLMKREAQHLSGLKKEFRLWVKQLVSEGVQSEEIASRARLSYSYDSIFWYQFLYLINFWRNDKSRGFERTDVAIEKSVSLTFDLIERNALDSAFDFGKFLFQDI